MTAAWNAWCLFWGILDAAIIVGLLVVMAWSAVPKRGFRRDKRTPFRACPTCRYLLVSASESPCRECQSGDSQWVES